MDAELWRTAQRIFHDATALDPETRRAFVADACGSDEELRGLVERLLRADASAPTWLDGGADRAAGLSPAVAGDDVPDRLGPYRVTGVLGSGGMGTVYEGEREDDFRMRVALKRVRPGPASAELLDRFQQERQILARLQHPGIARLLDGGEGPDGRPWFAMEYVEGVPLDAWCDERRLEVAERVRLFVRICRIVQYAHLNLVLHRDLKPSNVLVTPEGEPKLLDFGIARLLDPHGDPGLTLTGLRQPLTPEYASPEQFRDVPLTTASDVYQLGLMLYRLLTGRGAHAHRTTGYELARARVEEEPGRPSAALDTPGEGQAPAVEVADRRRTTPERLRRELRGDLDAILLKALRPEPDRRYPSAEALADDLERHLAGIPVRARAPSPAYRAGRFVRRHRLPVGLAAAALGALVTGTVVAAEQARRAARERDAAAETAGFLEDLLSAPDPFSGGSAFSDSMRLGDFIEQADARIRNDLTDRPGVRARMLTLLGRVHLNLGSGARAVTTLREAVEANRTASGPGSPETVAAVRALGFALAETGGAEEGEALLREALDAQAALTGEASPEAAEIRELLARTLLDARRLDEAEPLLRASADARRRATDPDDAALAGVLNMLGAVRSFRGDDPGALPLMEEAVAALERAGAGQRGNLAVTRGNLGGLLRRLGRFEDADAALSRAVDELADVVGPGHPLHAGAQANLAAVRARLGRPQEADRLWAEAVGALERGAPGNLALAGELGAWARFLREDGRLGEAEARARAGVEAAARIGGPGHPLVALNEAVLGDILRDAGRLDEADQAYGRALDGLAGAPPPDPNGLGIRVSRAELRGRLGRDADAEGELRAVQQEAERAFGRGHPLERRAAAALVAFLEARGRGGEADPFR